MKSDHLLIELGTEELPPTALKELSDAFTKELLDGLVTSGLINESARQNSQSFATPRRLALLIPDVQASQPDQSSERRGPAIQAAFDKEGNPTPAALGFAKSCNTEVDQLDRLKTDKGEWLSYTINEAGKSLDSLITNLIEQAIKRLPIAKRMRWGAGAAEFVRPVQWLVLMYGNKVLPTSILGIESGNTTFGHRFHSTGEITLNDAQSYAETLERQGYVIADFAKRQAMIATQIDALAKSVSGKVEADQALLDEVTGLVEQPTALLGDFDQSFLDVPAECLVSAMRDHQKYFHILDQDGKLKPNFITVSNINSSDPDRVVNGNERVLRARLSDAQFFWETDRKQTLESWLPKLDSVMFHVKLGSVGQKVERITTLAEILAKLIGAEQSSATRAAKLAKADLVTNMVGEFDKLQGLMGRYYANFDGEDPAVANAIEQHYWPRYAGDHLPDTKVAQTVALADRLDSLVGIYAAGEVPTGDKDPYSLRRAALAILRILIEQEISANVSELVSLAANNYASQGLEVEAKVQKDIVEFIRSRLPAYYQSQQVELNAINAVIACSPDSPLDFDQRLRAVKVFKELEEAEDLAAANKRINNILKKSGTQTQSDVNESLLGEPAEITLFAALQKISPDVNHCFNQGDYTAGLKQLAELRAPVDDFFEQVMVMSEDIAQQKNRLAILQRIQQLFMRVADITQLQAS